MFTRSNDQALPSNVFLEILFKETQTKLIHWSTKLQKRKLGCRWMKRDDRATQLFVYHFYTGIDLIPIVLPKFVRCNLQSNVLFEVLWIHSYSLKKCLLCWEMISRFRDLILQWFLWHTFLFSLMIVCSSLLWSCATVCAKYWIKMLLENPMVISWEPSGTIA